MSNVYVRLKEFALDEAGATSIEYALIASIVSISIVAAATALRGELQNTYTSVATGLKNATN
jgi:pilus assembly protein Flp/PilA